MNRYTLTPYTHTPHSHPCTQTDPTTTRRFEDRFSKEITEIIQGSVGNRCATIPLWLHGRETAPENMEKNPSGNRESSRARTHDRPLHHRSVYHSSYGSIPPIHQLWHRSCTASRHLAQATEEAWEKRTGGSNYFAAMPNFPWTFHLQLSDTDPSAAVKGCQYYVLYLVPTVE
jgi:hypothetical protein